MATAVMSSGVRYPPFSCCAACNAAITAEQMTALLAPVPVDESTLGSVAGRSPDDELAAMIMTVMLFIAITSYGNLVLTGVVEEKASRVVEVLLARMPARSLLAGTVAGIGLLGLAQFAVTALAACQQARRATGDAEHEAHRLGRRRRIGGLEGATCEKKREQLYDQRGLHRR